MARKRSSWGCVQEVVKGKKYRIRWTEDTSRGRKRRSETFYGTRREANARKDQLHAEVLARSGGRYGGTPTVGQVHDRWWLPAMETSRSAGTMKAYASAWRVHVAPRWADVPCDQVRKGDVQDWLLGIPGGVAGSCRNVLSGVLERARNMGFVDSNAAQGRFEYAGKTYERDKSVWTLAELAAADDAVRGLPCEAAFLLMAHGGLRVGEALGVRRDEATFRRVDGRVVALVDVRRTVGQSGALGPLKTRSSARTVAVGEPWSLRLRTLWRAARASRDVWLCDRGDGTPFPQWKARQLWETACADAGIEPIPLHNLRNSYETSQNWELGEAMERVSKMMGHAKPTTSYRHYDRPRVEAMARRAAAASARVEAILRDS